MKKETTLHIIISGLLLSMGILLPIIFHSFGILGQVFLPMHLTIFVGGFFLPTKLATTIGILTPLLSSFITGMPVLFPIAIIMSFELATYGFVIAIMKKNLSVISCLVLSMVSGRITAGIVAFILSTFFGVKLNAFLFIKTAIITGLPGLLVQIILIPSIVISIQKYFSLQE